MEVLPRDRARVACRGGARHALTGATALVALLILGAVSSRSALPSVSSVDAPVPSGKDSSTPAGLIDLVPIIDADYRDDGRPAAAKVALGQALFFDKILSGNRNISCATCHHPDHASADAAALGLGEGATGLGAERVVDAVAPVPGRVPRNAPALFNLGAREFDTLFHDGRVEGGDDDTPGERFWTPARAKLPAGLDSVLAAQALFPVLSATEMAGQRGENAVADAVAANRIAGPGGAWALLVERLRELPRYVELFEAAFPELDAVEKIDITHAANAIAAFEATAFRADGSPFDAYLRGDEGALDAAARRGMALFYGEAGCSDCHAGVFQTDHRFHSIAMPQIGPGKGDGTDQSYWLATGFDARLEDRGRYRVSADPADLYRFRTPSLRNVELTGPWGHAGAFDSLEAVVRHHLDPVGSLERYRVERAALPTVPKVVERRADGSRWRLDPIDPRRMRDYARRDGWVQSQPALRAVIAESNELVARTLSDAEVDDLVAFLAALTDPASLELGHLVPSDVPSGLPVAD